MHDARIRVLGQSASVQDQLTDQAAFVTGQNGYTGQVGPPATRSKNIWIMDAAMENTAIRVACRNPCAFLWLERLAMMNATTPISNVKPKPCV